MPKYPPDVIVSRNLYRLGTYARAEALMINAKTMNLNHFIQILQAEKIFEDDLPVVYLLGHKGTHGVIRSLDSHEQLKFYAIFFNKKINCLQILEESNEGKVLEIPSLPKGRTYHQL